MSQKNSHEKRPWGEFYVLKETDDYKVKEIKVIPGKRLSYQYHNKRSEIWVIAKGIAKVTLNDEIIYFNEGEILTIPTKAKHRVENEEKEDLIIIEIQKGEYFGEDDITRLEDDFQRI